MNAHGEVVRDLRWSATAERVRDARYYAGETVAAETIGACDEDVRLVASELVTNAVVHARTPFTVTVVCTGNIVLIEVTDGSKVFRPVTPSAWWRAPGKTTRPEDFTSLINDLEAHVFGRLPDETWCTRGTATTPPWVPSVPISANGAKAAGNRLVST
jgi:hypothetical protein